MATIRDIKRHIRSVGNIKKITRTMQMVAGAKMQKTSQALIASRPYARIAWNMLLELSAGTERELHPLLQARPVRSSLFVIVSTDRGLCGPLNINLNAAALKMVPGRTSTRIVTIGRKAREFFMRGGFNVIAEFTGLSAPVNYLQVQPISHMIIDEYTRQVVDEVKIMFTDYVSNLLQKPAVLRLLPVERERLDKDRPAASQFIYEPSPAGVIASLVPRIIEYEIYESILESQASEFAARMMAMKNATENAEQLIDGLTLAYNKARQEGITKELSELSTSKAVIEKV
jgi:F-type H+-transporting ATPase subunit gamma